MNGIHQERQEPERQTDLADVEGPARTLTDHERLDLLAEQNGLTKEEVLKRATFDDSGRLTKLFLGYTDVKDISALKGCTSLTELSLDWTEASLSPLAGHTALSVLSVRHHNVRDLSPLAECRALTRLSLSNTLVSDLSPLAGHTALTELSLDFTDVNDLSPLAGCTELTYLDVSYTQVRDISPLGGCKALRRLLMFCTDVRDLSATKGLTNLTSLQT